MLLVKKSSKFLLVVVLAAYCLPNNIVAKPLEGQELKNFFAYKQGDLYLGVHPSKANVVMVEYGSLSCYYCKQFFLKVIPDIKRKFIDDKGLSLSIICREFVSDGPSLVVATLLQCLNVDKGKRYKILANLYKTQSDWAFSGDSYNKIQEVFMAHGYNRYEVSKCAQNNAISQSIVEEQKNIIEKGGLTGTPMIIINGKPVEDVRPTSVVSQIELAFGNKN
ncbi:MAG: thioredoxin domain-containing protein [Alphaproteobacteria bacterium]|nr:thioredoxin domain-containing protein [Rickettsiales bacterium]